MRLAFGAFAAEPPDSQRPPRRSCRAPGLRVAMIAVSLVVVAVSMPSAVSGQQSEGGAPQSTFSVEAFQTDLFTGAATAQIPIVVPPGAAGPKIVLRYNSG